MGRETKEARAARQRLEFDQFVSVLKAAGNVVECEVRFDARPLDKHADPVVPRRWRIDVAIPCCVTQPLSKASKRLENVAIEIEGFTGGMGGGHQRVKQFKDNIAKHSELFGQGWTLLRISRAMVSDGSALDLLARRGVRVEKAD